MCTVSSARREQGLVIGQAVIAVAVVAIIVGTIMMITLRSVASSSEGSRRASAQGAVEAGIAVYRQALVANAASEANGWMPSQAQLERLVTGSSKVVPLAQLQLQPPFDRLPEGAPPVAVRIRSDDGTSMYWQLVHANGPGYGSTTGTVVVWVRGWRSSDSGQIAGSPMLARAVFTPGGFHQFQLMSESPIRFANGAQISGPVHSNGGGGGPAISVEPGATVSCSGAQARVSASTGSIDGIPASCARADVAGTRFTLGSVAETFDAIRAAAAGGGRGVHVVNTTGDPNGFVPVQLQPDGTVIAGGTPLAVGGGLAVLVHGNVLVSGTTTGRVTIASDPGAGAAGSAGRIRISGDLRASGDGAAIGLYTAGDVELDSAACTSRIDAAIIAAGGTLTINRGLRTEVRQGDAPRCGAITVNGSIAAAEGPVLRWQWQTGEWTGYERRDYVWNPNLVRRPPPWSPVIDGWQNASWAPADQSCWLNGKQCA